MGRIVGPFLSDPPDWALRYPGDLLESTDRLRERQLMDIGSGVFISPLSDSDSRFEHIGIFVLHQHPTGALCEGLVLFDVPGNEGRRTLWQVHSWDPLTITPSVLRTDCGLHGFITDGRWVGC